MSKGHAINSIDTLVASYYNVRHDKRFHCDDYIHINSTPNPPRLTLPEVRHMMKLTTKLLVKYGNPYDFLLEERKKYYSSSAMAQMSDRTSHICFIRMSDCTVELIRKLLKSLDRKCPLWRYLINGYKPSTSILVCGSTVKFGSLEEGDWSCSLQKIIDNDRIERGAGYALLCEQLDILRGHVRTVLCEDKTLCSPIVAFNNWRGNFDRLTLWTAQSRSVSDLNIVGVGDYSIGTKYWTKANGDFGEQVLDTAPYWIREWVLSKFPASGKLAFDIEDSREIVEMNLGALPFIRQTLPP